jgi:hypothetical protein
MFSFNSQMNNNDDKKEYTIQITTDNYEQFKFMQDMARECVDGKHKEGCLAMQEWLKDYNKVAPVTNYDDFTLVPNTTQFIPDACKNCSNHPSNGGSGICNCTLGLPTVK